MKELPKPEQIVYFKAELAKINRFQKISKDSQSKSRPASQMKKQGIRQILAEKNRNIELAHQLNSSYLQLENDI